MPGKNPRRFVPESVTTQSGLESRELLTTLSAGLVIRDLTSGIANPTTFIADHENQIFVGNLDGWIQSVSAVDGHLHTIGKLDAENVDSRGLYGMLLDPGFDNNHTMYVFYYAVNDTGGHEARVSKLILQPADASTAEDPEFSGFNEQILMTIKIPNAPAMHHGGALEIDTTGHLFFAIGDLEQPEKVANINTPNGKVFRINTDGTIPKDNPFYRRSRGLGRAVWATGLREPMKSSYNAKTNMLMIQDVGHYQQEEINVIQRGKNYGWPFFEGTYHGRLRGGNGNRIEFPYYSYQNLGSIEAGFKTTRFTKRFDSPIAKTDDTGCAILGGAFYQPTRAVDSALASYKDDYLFVDLCSGWVNAIDFQTKTVTRLATDIDAQLLDLDYTNDGKILLLTRGDNPSENKILLIDAEEPVAPLFSKTGGSLINSAGESLTLSAVSTGPGPIAYEWLKNDAPIDGETSSTLTINSLDPATSPGSYTLTATNAYGTTESNPWIVQVTSQPRPTIDLTVSKDGESIQMGDIINFSATATDTIDGQLAPSQFTWKVELKHNTHKHPLQELTNTTSGQFSVGDFSYETGTLSIWLTLTVTNSSGLTQTIQKSWPIVK